MTPLPDSPLDLWTDDEVRRAASAMMPLGFQRELSDLLADQRESRLTPDGRARLDELMAEYRSGLLAKAKAIAEAARRGMA